MIFTLMSKLCTKVFCIIANKKDIIVKNHQILFIFASIAENKFTHVANKKK